MWKRNDHETVCFSVPKHEIFHMPPIPMYTDNAFWTLALNFESSKHSLPMTGPTDKIEN